MTGLLIDAANGLPIWADRYDHDLTDIFAVQDESTQEIIAALKVKLTPEVQSRLDRKSTIDVEAYNIFHRARRHASRLTKADNEHARGLLQCVLKMSPGFGAARADATLPKHCVSEYRLAGR